MLTAVIHGERDIRVEDLPEPVLASGPDASGRDAIVRVVASCVCGSDLWPYRGFRSIDRPRPMGHEFVGVVEQVGGSVNTVNAGDFVIPPSTSVRRPRRRAGGRVDPAPAGPVRRDGHGPPRRGLRRGSGGLHGGCRR
ncbi:MAG TPA: alcohol dehydrogenase catalytic domain-containing protein [Streptosporangiaceae bacterium]|nr:alcohol dehydrogenase catalytic domain-containing protein [Streptosporangiaceae bacterium]